MQCPRGIGQVRPRNSTQVCSPCRNDRIYMIAFKNVANGDSRNCDLVADLVGKRNLEHAAIHRLLRLAHLSGVTIDYVSSSILKKASDFRRVVRCEATRD